MYSNTGASKDPFHFSYSGYSTRSNNFSNSGPHTVHIKNSMADKSVQVIGWTVKKGRLEQDFTKNLIRAGLFNSARLIPAKWVKGDPVLGAVVFRIQNTDNYYTLAFEDSYMGTGKEGFKGYIIQGNNPECAIAALQGQLPMQVKNSKYYIDEYAGKPRTVIQFVDN